MKLKKKQLPNNNRLGTIGDSVHTGSQHSAGRCLLSHCVLSKKQFLLPACGGAASIIAEGEEKTNSGLGNSLIVLSNLLLRCFYRLCIVDCFLN